MRKENIPVGTTRGEKILLVLLVALLSGCYFWTAGGAGFSGQAEGYYNLQTAGFLQGHLHVAVEPHPGLLALPDPYDPVANAPYRIHDMTFWQGKYYLYFGVAPVLLLFLPVRVLTGHFILEPTAVALFLSLGLAFSALTVAGMRRYFFPQAGTLLLLVLVAAQALAGPTILLTQAVQFYQVPIACAYALAMAGFWCLLRCITAEPRRRQWWFCAAGICFGLTLAARPNYILAMSTLALPLWWLWREEGLLKAPWQKKLRLALVTYGPVATVGIGLLLYNWARFGDATEFGMRYQLAGQSFVDFTPLHVKYLWPHLQEYAWGKIWWQLYFPFLDLGPDAPYGVWRYLPLTWLGLLAFWPRRFPGEVDVSRRLILAVVIAGLGATNLVVNSIFFFAPVSRYLCDFAAAFLLLGALGGLAMAHALPRSRLVPICVGILAVWSVTVTMGVFVYRLTPASYPTELARLLNRGVGMVERMQGKQFGGIRLAVELPAVRNAEAVEPIFQTGVKADRRNWLQLHYLPEGRARFGFFHAGLGELLGEEFTLPEEGRFIVDAYCSAFLPPDSHPLYDGWSAEAIATARTKLDIRVDGRSVLAAALPCYPSSSWDLLLGRRGFLPGAEDRIFSGTVRKIKDLPLIREQLPPKEINGILAPQTFQLQMPAHLNHGFEPLIATGKKGQGELLYAIYHPGHKVQFGLDGGGLGSLLSRTVSFNPTTTQTLTVWLGSWALSGQDEVGAATRPDQPGPRRLYVEFNGEVVLNGDRPFSPGADTSTALGWNRIGAGSAGPTFSGRILSVNEAKAGAVPELVRTGSYGTVDMLVDLPDAPFGRAEPLVVTGEAGAGDVLYIKYLDAHHVVFGHDHWGKGGMVSRPVRINYDTSVRLEISLGALHAQQDGPWASKLWLRVNGQLVLDETADFHPARPEQISLGLNAIGSSSCGAEFTGQILRVERPLVPR